MKEKPIIFSTPMVKAILEGRKTQTRRVVKPQPEFAQIYRYKGKALYEGENRTWCWKNHVSPDTWHEIDWLLQFAPYQPGDVLWVRETWLNAFGTYKGGAGIDYSQSHYLYKADHPEVEYKNCWKPSIHMPRKAARLFLRVKNVRVERVQDITEEDAKAEGVIPFPYDPEGDCWNDGKYKTAFEYLWNTLHGWNPNAWGRNDWVWVIEFEIIQESEVEKG